MAGHAADFERKMGTYDLYKLAHISCVMISGGLFVYRYARLNILPERPLPKLLKVLPHINDAILLSTAITMLYLVRLNPFAVPWLQAKIVSLLIYIVLGAICIRSMPRSRRQAMSFVAAISVFSYIVFVAMTKQAFPVEIGDWLLSRR